MVTVTVENKQYASDLLLCIDIAAAMLFRCVLKLPSTSIIWWLHLGKHSWCPFLIAVYTPHSSLWNHWLMSGLVISGFSHLFIKAEPGTSWRFLSFLSLCLSQRIMHPCVTLAGGGHTVMTPLLPAPSMNMKWAQTIHHYLILSCLFTTTRSVSICLLWIIYSNRGIALKHRG